jgi:outer membrane protein OmpA-like peptidoglycan-associated protein
MKRSLLVSVLVCSVLAASASAQDIRRSAAIAGSDVLSQISLFTYSQGSKSDLAFRGTPRAPNASGEAEVEYEDGNARISAKVEGLPPASSLGPYTIYVLWALTPDGRASNLGVLTTEDKGKLDTTYAASQFALIVTAEPHFAVTIPSNLLMLYNVGEKVQGQQGTVSTLVAKADYSGLEPITVDDDQNPLELVQARYAVAIADQAGAERYAPEAYQKASDRLKAAEEARGGSRKERKTEPDLARQAVVAGEDAWRAAMIASQQAQAQAEKEAAAQEAAASERARSEGEIERSREQGAAAASATAREEIRNRLEAVLPTRETERGLVSEIGGVQFATGAADLSMPARESLARFSGIVASYPGMHLNIEGYTDNTGPSKVNEDLSLKRAISVRDYLISQGIPASSIDVRGLGPANPIADNSTAEGRARNRRVEIVLSGGPLGEG